MWWCVSVIPAAQEDIGRKIPALGKNRQVYPKSKHQTMILLPTASSITAISSISGTIMLVLLIEMEVSPNFSPFGLEL
jgi:hypothetical protein